MAPSPHHEQASYRLFSSAKAMAAASLVATLMPRAARSEVMRALFLAEVRHLGAWGRPVIGDTWVKQGDAILASRTTLLVWPATPELELLSVSDQEALSQAACTAWCDDGSYLRSLLGRMEEGEALPWLVLLQSVCDAVSDEQAETFALYQHSGVMGPVDRAASPQDCVVAIPSLRSARCVS